MPRVASHRPKKKKERDKDCLQGTHKRKQEDRHGKKWVPQGVLGSMTEVQAEC